MTTNERAALEHRIHQIRSLLEESDSANAAGEPRSALYSATAAITLLLRLVCDLSDRHR